MKKIPLNLMAIDDNIKDIFEKLNALPFVQSHHCCAGYGPSRDYNGNLKASVHLEMWDTPSGKKLTNKGYFVLEFNDSDEAILFRRDLLLLGLRLRISNARCRTSDFAYWSNFNNTFSYYLNNDPGTVSVFNAIQQWEQIRNVVNSWYSRYF